MAVQIDYSSVVRLHPQALTVRACVENDRAMQIIPSGRNRLSSLTLGRGAVRAGHTAGVTLAITDDAGRDVFAGVVGITPGTGRQQDWSECPTAWIGQVVAKGHTHSRKWRGTDQETIAHPCPSTVIADQCSVAHCYIGSSEASRLMVRVER
jgi:hypothetical protein